MYRSREGALSHHLVSRLCLLGTARRLLTALLVAGVSACSDDGPADPSGEEQTTTFYAVAADQTQSGSVAFTIASPTLSASLASFSVSRPAFATAAAEVSVTGTLKLGTSASISLSGTYNTTTHALTASGGGYTFTGTYTDGELSGTFAGPNGEGAFSGQSGTSVTVTTFCGTFQGSNDHGYFNFSVNQGTGKLSGVGVSQSVEGGTTYLSGTVSNNTLSFTYPTEMGTGTATGTIAGNGVSGSYSSPGDGTGGGDNGTFEGSVCD